MTKRLKEHMTKYTKSYHAYEKNMYRRARNLMELSDCETDATAADILCNDFRINVWVSLDPNVVNHPHILYNLSSIIFDTLMSSIKLFKRNPWSTYEYPMDCLAIFFVLFGFLVVVVDVFVVLALCLGSKFLPSSNVLDFCSSKSMK
ncbi:hypothetical protein QTP88_002495 [Uroleucon formosanum]